MTSAALLTERREQFLLVSDQGILLYRWDDLQAPPALLCPYPQDAAGTRPNEAAIAPDGSLWFSTMDINESAPLGGWYRFAPGDSRPVKMAGAMTIPNTLAWHEDRVWFADSAERLFFSSSGRGIVPQEMRSHSADHMTGGFDYRPIRPRLSEPLPDPPGYLDAGRTCAAAGHAAALKY